MEVPPPSTGKPEPIRPNKPIHAPSIDPNYDFTGVVREAMPFWVLKMAKHGAVKSHIIVGREPCVECHRLAWTCDKKLEDTCDECNYILFQQLSDMRQQTNKRHAQIGVLNPFTPTDDE